MDLIKGKFARVRCGASVFGFSCSLEKGHEGNHRAYNGDDLNAEILAEARTFSPTWRELNGL